MSKEDLALTAHLLRRAGFGATRDELERYTAMGYETATEDILHPEQAPDVDEDLLRRFSSPQGLDRVCAPWVFRMAVSKRTLTEKMALFLHYLFPTASEKSGPFVSDQIEMFRTVCLGDLRTVLTRLSADPAMIMWLDNQENHRTQINENYGRELLELFSMGVGNYTEEDVKSSAHAFTGWSFETPIPGGSTREGGFPTEFIYRADDHDGDRKSFLGETGRFNGEDVIEIIIKQPATARFVSRHLYSFFVADEPVVASWNETPPQDPEAIDTLVTAYFDSNADFRSMLRVLFNSDFFKAARYKRVKSPVELIMGVVKLLDEDLRPFPEQSFRRHAREGLMGQALMNPLTVEGWHTGRDWIDGGTLNERVNYAAEQVGDTSMPGVQGIIRRLCEHGRPLTPDEFVDECLDLAGPVVVDEDTRDGLLRHAETEGDLKFDGKRQQAETESRVARMLQLIVATREYQFN